MSSNNSGTTMPHGWVEDVLMDVMTYCAMNGLHRIAEAIEPALRPANALSLPHAPPVMTHAGAPNSPQ